MLERWRRILVQFLLGLSQAEQSRIAARMGLVVSRLAGNL
jgi:hypothetical protein